MSNLIGENVQWQTDGHTLIITIDLDAPTRPSKSMKTNVIASTQGNKKLQLENGDAVYLGVNCYRYAGK